MKLYKYILFGMMSFGAVACSDWTEVERDTFPEQEEINQLIPLIEAQTEADLTPKQREYFKKLREEYRPSPHVKGFGWYGNWTGKGTNAQNYLKMLPDSVDFVSLWGARGNLSEEQKADLKFFQDIKGGQALLCWICQDIGSAITPEGENMHTYWVNLAKENGATGNEKEIKNEAAKLYAHAIADTVVKYNLDGFDIDWEPGYGHTGTLATSRAHSAIGQDKTNTEAYWFIKTLRERFDEFEKAPERNGRPVLLVMDGEPYCADTETSEMLDHYIYQAYWESTKDAVIRKIQQPHLKDWERKTIITVEFEQNWRIGGTRHYRESNPELRNYVNEGESTQLLEYACMDLPSGLRIGGVGTYHMEYDFKNSPEYKWLRLALYLGNQKYPGKFQ